MLDRVESKRLHPGTVCIHPGRPSRSWRGCLSRVSSGFLVSYSSFQGEPRHGGMPVDVEHKYSTAEATNPLSQTAKQG